MTQEEKLKTIIIELLMDKPMDEAIRILKKYDMHLAFKIEEVKDD